MPSCIINGESYAFPVGTVAAGDLLMAAGYPVANHLLVACGPPFDQAKERLAYAADDWIDLRRRRWRFAIINDGPAPGD